VGFLTLSILFAFRSDQVPNYWYALVAVTAQGGYLLGSGLAPVLRRKLAEEFLVMIGGGITYVIAMIASLYKGLGGACLLAFAVGATSSLAKQGFDSLVQRDAPDANRGRTFAKFESRFQLVWVLGAFIPVALPIPQEGAFLTIALLSLFATGSYAIGYRQIRAAAAGLRPPIPPRLPLVQRLYYLVRPTARPAPVDPAAPRDPAFDAYNTAGFLVDPIDPLDPLDPTIVDPAHVGVSPGLGLPPLAPSNPLVGGRWRSPEPEELFTTVDVPLPIPPPDVTPTGIFAPAVPSSPRPVAAEPIEPPPAPGTPWFGEGPSVVTLEDLALSGYETVVTDAPPATAPVGAAPPAPTAPASHPAPEPVISPPPSGAAEPVEATLPFADQPSSDGWEIQEPRWRDTGAQPLPGLDPYDTLDGEPPATT
jgi:hypothetical protein